MTDTTVRPETVESATPEPRWRTLVARFGPVLALVLLPLVLVPLHVAEYTKVGPMDELQHIDYLYKAPELVAPGDKVGQDAMREQSCRGIDFETSVPPCEPGARYSPSDFQENGYNTASGNTPVYYSVTKALGAVLAPFSPGSNLVTDGRLAGSVWLALGLVLTYVAGRRFGVRRGPLLAVLVLVGCAPSNLYVSSTVTPDASALAVGAGALLALLWWEERPARRWPVLALVVTVGMLLKATHVVVFLAIGAYVLLRLLDHVRGRRAGSEEGLSGSATATPRQLVVAGAAVLVPFLVVQVGWLLLQASLGQVDPTNVPMARRFGIDRLPFAHAVEQLGVLLNPLDSVLAEVGPGEYLSPVQRAGGYLLLAGLLGTAMLIATQPRTRTLAQAVALTGLLGGSVFVLLNYVGQGVFFATPPRYGLTLVPAMVVLTAAALRGQAPYRVVWLAAVAAFVISVYRLTAF